MNKLDCRQALARLYEYLDGELTDERAAQVRHHLEICKGCYPHVNFCRSFQDALHRAGQCQPDAPAELRARVLELLRAEGVATED